MPSLFKKKSDASAASLVPAWHPNFRNYEKLPDIKVVRTAFFVNGAAIFAALGLLLYFCFQEWQLHVINAQIATAEAQIRLNKPGSDQAVALYGKFKAEEAKFAEVDAFVKSKPIVSDLILHLGQTLPKNVALENLDLRETGLALRIVVRGAPEAAAGYASAYLEQLRTDKEFARFDEVTATSSSRNAATGRLSVEVMLRLKVATAKKP